MDRTEWTDDWNQDVFKQMEDGSKSESSEGDWTGLTSSRVRPAPKGGRSEKPLRVEAAEITRYKTSLNKAQAIALVIALQAWVLTPLIPSVPYRVAISLFTMGLLIKLFISFQDKANSHFDTLIRLVSSLTANGQKRIMKLKNFAACEPFIESECLRPLLAGQNLDIRLQVVAAFYSWGFFQPKLQEWCRRFPQQTVTFRIALVQPDHLRARGAGEWAARCETTLAEIYSLKAKSCCRNLDIRVSIYDQIPQGHGVVINNHVYFAGKTEWVHSKEGMPELRVGSRPYTRYSIDDPDGVAEVLTFLSWMQWFEARSDELATAASADPASIRKSQRHSRKLPLAPPLPQRS